MGAASAILDSSITGRKIALSLADFKAHHCERDVPFSSLSPHLWLQADGENFFGRSVVLDCLSLLVVFGDAAEPIKYLTERMS